MRELHIITPFCILLFIFTGTQGLNSALYGESCDVDKQCLTRQMTCESGTCRCIDQHYASEDNRNCIAKARSACYESADCYGLQNSECHEDEKTCVCISGYQPSEDYTQCLAESRYQGSCELKIQCTATLGDLAVCQIQVDTSAGICNCTTGSHYSTIEQRCIQTKYLNDACVNVTQCMTKELKENQATCKDGKCVCNEGKYERDGLCK
ncbi:hypothetical protein L9F63_009461, partial [Diploptera punctata]